MKTLIVLLFSLLSACGTLPERGQNLPHSSTIPQIWQIQGRLSTSTDSATKTANFVLKRKAENYQLSLSNSFGFGQMQVEQTKNGLLIDDKLTNMSLQEWMKNEIGWYFSPQELEQIVFKNNLFFSKKWQVKVPKYQAIDGTFYPKIIQLENLRHLIKIKLLIREVNRLK
ncbi:MAG: hypothetical protein FXV79_02700 [Candidatus Thioglobus sp.]|nr:MAG: hypothetical protein FXV80_02690 [Candidatus Thioglobus sp.]KAA0451264.1 MAG: hypothetical protein FXV79_02700 [Candidatus Thioglobus sp.]